MTLLCGEWRADLGPETLIPGAWGGQSDLALRLSSVVQPGRWCGSRRAAEGGLGIYELRLSRRTCRRSLQLWMLRCPSQGIFGPECKYQQVGILVIDTTMRLMS
jgi:hypothetical protein